MDIEQALEFANHALFKHKGRHLSDVETLILRGAWGRQTYDVVAATSNYSENYLRKDAGPKLWRDLSAALGEAISKTNFRAALERQWDKTQRSPTPTLPTAVPNHVPNRQTDWGEVIDVSVFFGRSTEQQTLMQWAVADRCRFIVPAR
jgi:hypothetical protein